MRKPGLARYVGNRGNNNIGNNSNNMKAATTTTTTTTMMTMMMGRGMPRSGSTSSLSNHSVRFYHFTSPTSDPATVRLYRILLRQCQTLQRQSQQRRSQQQQRQSQSPPILLQYPLNPHLAGTCRTHLSSLVPTTTTSTTTPKRQPQPPARPVTTACHVLRLFGQWREQELRDRLMDHTRTATVVSSSSSSNGNGDEYDHDEEDEEESRVEEEEDKLISWITSVVEAQQQQQQQVTGADPWMDTTTLWTTPETVREAIRLAFRHNMSINNDTDDEERGGGGGAVVAAAAAASVPANRSDHRTWSIRAYQYLVAQTEMQRLVRHREERGVLITAVARCVGRSSTAVPTRTGGGGGNNGNNGPVSYRYRFVYRIRIENTTPDRAFQLLGRSWIIQECQEEDAPSSVISTGINTGDVKKMEKEKKKSVVFGDGGSNRSIKVHAPQTGAVGKHPVLEPGQFFEYMSGCDLAAPMGVMKGSFHFAWVPAGTPSASVGQAVPALDESHADRRFEVPVAPFPLRPDTLPVQYDT